MFILPCCFEAHCVSKANQKQLKQGIVDGSYYECSYDTFVRRSWNQSFVFVSAELFVLVSVYF